MVEISFINGEQETVETRDSIYAPWEYDKNSECFMVPANTGNFMYPRDFVKSIKYFEV